MRLTNGGLERRHFIFKKKLISIPFFVAYFTIFDAICHWEARWKTYTMVMTTKYSLSGKRLQDIFLKPRWDGSQPIALSLRKEKAWHWFRVYEPCKLSKKLHPEEYSHVFQGDISLYFKNVFQLWFPWGATEPKRRSHFHLLFSKLFELNNICKRLQKYSSTCSDVCALFDIATEHHPETKSRWLETQLMLRTQSLKIRFQNFKEVSFITSLLTSFK